jgi:hypothetical protein
MFSDDQVRPKVDSEGVAHQHGSDCGIANNGSAASVAANPAVVEGEIARTMNHHPNVTIGIKVIADMPRIGDAGYYLIDKPMPLVVPVFIAGARGAKASLVSAQLIDYGAVHKRDPIVAIFAKPVIVKRNAERTDLRSILRTVEQVTFFYE